MASSKRPPTPTQLRQRQAIDEAKAELMPDTVINVFGLPEVRLMGERYCHEEHAKHVVVYHVRVVPLSNGGFYCLNCGATTEDPDGTA